MKITRNRAFLVEPVGHIIVARDAADAQADAHKRFGQRATVTTQRINPHSRAPIHYTDAARRLDTYA